MEASGMPTSHRYIESFGADEPEEEYHFSEDEVLEIQENYKRKRLIESLIGPCASTIFHIALIIILALVITDKYKEPVAEIEVKMAEIEEIKIEEPPPIEEPVPEEIEETDVTNPVLTTVAIENVETNDAALEDVNDEAPSTEDDSTVEAVSDITVSPSAFASPTVFGGRSAAGRASAVSKFGGNQLGQSSLLKALWWLKKVQNPNGSWGTGAHASFTSMALLTFLAHGETQTSKNFGLTVQKAMEWLINDPIEKVSMHAYPHAIKTYAISEAFAMTGVSMLEDKMNKCIRVLIDGQQNSGSYDYNYKKSEQRQDLSFAGWNYQALKAAYGAGCEEKGLENSIFKAITWLKKAADLQNGFPYDLGVQPNGVGTHTMRAVGTLCLQLYGEGQTPEIKDDLERISTFDLKNYDWGPPPMCSLYGWYYATQTMFQQGGPMWKKWNKKFQKVLVNNQHSEGYWVYPGKHHANGFDDLTQKVYATTLSALQLTVYYRYLPSTKGAIGAKQANKNKEKKKKMAPDEGLDLLE